jgi:hypothetical protein
MLGVFTRFLNTSPTEPVTLTTTESARARDEAQLRQLINDPVSAIRAKMANLLASADSVDGEGSMSVMNDTHRPRRVLRRIGAVLAGLLAIFILSIGTDVALQATGVFPPFGQPMVDALFLLALAYRIVYGAAGCYIAARLAPDRPMQHALALGVVGLVLSTAGAVAMWDAGPAWYSLAVIAIALPCAWVGGRLRGMQLEG